MKLTATNLLTSVYLKEVICPSCGGITDYAGSPIEQSEDGRYYNRCYKCTKNKREKKMKNQQQKELLEIAKQFQRIVSHYGGGTTKSDEPDKTFFSSKFAHELLRLYGKTTGVLKTIKA